jgi:hypothetical protein
MAPHGAPEGHDLQDRSQIGSADGGNVDVSSIGSLNSSATSIIDFLLGRRTASDGFLPCGADAGTTLCSINCLDDELHRLLRGRRDKRDKLG